MKQSVFVQHSGAVCDFSSSDSWVILSPIEQSIKRKIEAVGTPLKDWDIQINYGIKTGYNDAFIIDTEKREAILANCQTEEERLNLYDRFCVAEILGDTGINGLNYGLSTFIMV